MPYDYIEEYQKQNDETIWLFHDKDAQEKIDTSSTETDYANPLSLEIMQAQLAKNTKIKIEPIQDLHGFTKPWVGGAGKNLLPLVLADLKSINTSGTWSGNTYAINNVTFTVEVDEDENITGIKINGTPSTNTYFDFFANFNSTEYAGMIFNGLTNIQGITVRIGPSNRTGIQNFYSGNNTIADNGDNLKMAIRIDSSIPQITNAYVYPMIRLSTESDATFAPYTNICPISGHDQIDILGCGKNLCDLDSVRIGIAWNDTHNSDRATVLTPILGNITYTLKVNAPNNMFDGNQFYVVQKDVNNVVVSTGLSVANNTAYTFTAEQTAILFIVQFNKTNIAKTDFANTTVQLEAGSEATEYVSYAGQSNNLSIDLPSTVYGGVLDLESGELVVDRAIVDLGSLSWQYRTDYKDNLYSTTSVTNYKKSSQVKALCSCYKFDGTASGASPMTYKEDGIICFFYKESENSKVLYVNDNRKLSAQDFTMAVAGEKIAYELATPFTLYISPERLKLLKAQNNLTTSQYTQIKVTYRNGVFVTLEELSDTANGIYDEISGDATTISGNPINFTTREKQKSKNTIIDLEPIQDLHGFTKPWAGGAGKNLLQLTVDGIKARNNGMTWNGNSTIFNNVTFTILTDADNNVIGIKVNGTAQNANANLHLPIPTINLSGHIVNGCPSGGSGSTYYIRITAPTSTYFSDYGSGATITNNGALVDCWIGVPVGGSANNLIFKPMLRLSTVTDATFEPYTNIASISGRSSVDIDGCGKNLLKLNQLTATTINGLTMTPVYSNGKLDYLNFNGTLSATTDFVIGGTFSVKQRFIFLGKGITYTFSRLYKNTGVQLLMRDGTENVITPNTDEYTFTLDKDTEIGSIFFRFSVAKYENIKIYPQLEVGSSASLYEPYTPSTDLTISFGTTVYGGRLDVEKGELVIDRGIADLGDLEWTRNTTQTSNVYRFISSSFSSDAKLPANNSIIANAISSVFTLDTIDRIYMGVANNASIGLSAQRTLQARADLYTDATTFTNAMTGQTICYELATPTTIQLTLQQVQLLKGINNISTTGTTITVTFKNGSVAHLDDLPENVFTDLDKEKLASIDTLVNALGLSVVDGKLCQTYNT